MDDLWVVLPHFGAGGAQKVGLLAAEHFAAQGLKVRVLSLRHGHPIKHALPDGVRAFDLGPDAQHPWLADVHNRSLPARGRRFLLAQVLRLQRAGFRLLFALCWPWIARRMRPELQGMVSGFMASAMPWLGGSRFVRLRQELLEQRPKRVLALLTKTNILCCAALWDQPVHLVVSERNDPRRQSLDRLWSRLRCLYYRRADVVTANTEGVLEALQAMGSWQRLDLLPNPLPGGLHLQGSAGSGQGELDGARRELEVLAVARLVPQKGLDLLIRAFASLPEPVRASWRLVLVGDGPERNALNALVQQQGISDQVAFEGFQADPLRYMQRASIFALPSRFEGMPNALLEAMASGLPSVVSDASPGPLEMVCDGRQGLVVPNENVDAFAVALERLMVDECLRLQLGAAAQDTLRALDWDVVEPHWRSVLALP